MPETSIMEMAKWYIGLLLIVLIVAVTVLGIKVSNINSYKQQVNYQIERHGGLTEVAVQNLKEYSDKNYKGAFAVESKQLNKKVQFGETVDYQVKATFKIELFNLPDVHMNFSGSASSHVR
ncbi:hypothetical protein [Bacillus albus]|uniref:hypothetical protein n=1 Tax=Bacillus albus TaxID=2026189 RepID=UPI0037D64D88